MISRLAAVFSLVFLSSLFYQCGQPMPPMGGLKDTLPPVLIKANPRDSAVNVKGNKITIEFNEYIQLQGLQQQLVVTPVPLVQPIIESKLKVVTIKLKDTLQPNTTYSINFGNALQDINENNPLQNFTYVFSTGSHIDTGKLSGRVVLAETGKADSTLLVVMHRNLADSAFSTVKPVYLARMNKEGFFAFRYLVPGRYNVFAIRDQDGGLKFDSPSETIAFLDSVVTITAQTEPIKLYAFTETLIDYKPPLSGSPKVPAAKDDRRLRYQPNLENGTLDVLGDLKVKFERKPTKFDSSRIRLTDEKFERISGYHMVLDSSTVKINYDWKMGTKYSLFLDKGLAEDSLGNGLLKNDTLKFETKKESDYGSLAIRTSGLDTNAHPVLLFYVGDELKRSVPLTVNRINIPLIPPGEYELRVLFDKNRNGIWDTGNFKEKKQPEIVTPRKQKMNIRPNWDNEVEINLQEVINQG